MDIDPPASSAFASSVVYSASNNSGLHVALHPLTLLNISDQYTRTKAQQNAGHSSTNNNSPYVIGALLGTQTGRDVDITNSYELLHTVDPETGKIIIDATYFVTKQEQFRQVFPLYDFLGWYSTGTSPTSKEIDIHKQMLLWNESPLYLQLDPSGISASSKSLPVTVYESIVDLVGGQALTMFVKTKYKIHTGEAERIAVEHVAHATAEGDGEASSLIPHLTSQRNAIKMLHTRIQLLHEYLQDVNAGTVPKNHTILRQIASLCNRMPAACATTEFREEFLTEYNDVLLASYLATVTRGTNDMNELVDKLNVVHGGAHNRRRGMFAA